MEGFVKDFLEKHIDGYLLCDVENMSMLGPLRDGNGACGYPMLMALLAGIELLGALYSDIPYPKKHEPSTSRNFPLGWDLLFAKSEEYSDAKIKNIFLRLLRHGLMHLYLSKPGVGILKAESEREHHLAEEGGIFLIHVTKFFEDFSKSYHDQAKQEILKKESSKDRLLEILERMDKESEKELGYSPSGDLSGAKVFAIHSTPQSATVLSEESYRIYKENLKKKGMEDPFERFFKE